MLETQRNSSARVFSTYRGTGDVGRNDRTARASSRQRWNQASARQESRSGEFTPRSRCTGEGAFISGPISFDVAKEGANDRAGGVATSVINATVICERQRVRSVPRGLNRRPSEIVLVARAASFTGLGARMCHRVYVAPRSFPVAGGGARPPGAKPAASFDRGYARERVRFGRVADLGAIPSGSTKSPSRRERSTGRRKSLNAGAGAQSGSIPFVGAALARRRVSTPSIRCPGERNCLAVTGGGACVARMTDSHRRSSTRAEVR